MPDLGTPYTVQADAGKSAVFPCSRACEGDIYLPVTKFSLVEVYKGKFYDSGSASAMLS